MAGGPQIAHHRSRAGESRLASLFRQWNREHAGGFRLALRRALASRVARLARLRVYGFGLEHQASAPVNREFGDLPTVVAGHAGTLHEGPLQPPARARFAIPGRRGNRARYRAERERPAQSGGGRTQRLSARAGFSVPATGELWPEGVEGGDRSGALSAQSFLFGRSART